MEEKQVQKKVRPTFRQKLAAKAIVKNSQVNNPKPLGEILENIGYSEGIAKSPSVITEAIGFKQALRDLGLTEELITSSLVRDIEAKPQARLGELKLGAEILQMVKREEDEPRKNINTTYNFLFADGTREKIREIEDSIKAKLTNVQEIKKDIPNEQEGS